MSMIMGFGGGAAAAGTSASNSSDLVIRSNCGRCGSLGTGSNELFAASCRHMTLCVPCGKAMAEAGAPCTECGTPVKSLCKEFKVKRLAPNSSKQYFVGRFPGGLPPFRSSRWSMRKDVPKAADQKFKITPERLKARPWILEDEAKTQQFHGQLEGGQQATYYVLCKNGREFQAMPVSSWFNYQKSVQYKQLTLEEAEEQMKNRKKTADGYQRWMMRAGNGADISAAKKGGDADEASRGGTKKPPGAPKVEEDDDVVKPEDFDEDEPVERGDDWEHEETFTDDDEAVGNDPEEREDLGPDVPAPPEIKQEEEDAEEGQTQEGGNGLSQSGRDMKKLLGKSAGLDESDGPEEDEEDEDLDPDNEDLDSPVLAPKKAEEAAAAKQSGGKAAGTSSKGKRKADDTKAPGSSAKKSKAEGKKEPSVKKEAMKKAAGDAAGPAAAAAAAAAGPASRATGPVTEEELKAVLKQSGPVKSQALVAKFKERLKTPEEKDAFASILKRISRIQKKDDISYIVLK